MVVNPVNVVNPPATETGPEGPQGPPGAQGIPGPTIYPPVGLAVSTGTVWGTSIDPATMPRLNTSNSFTGDQSIGGNIWVGEAIIGGVAPEVTNSGRNYSCYLFNDSMSPGTTRLVATCDGGSRGSVSIGGVGPGGGLAFMEYLHIDANGNAVFTGTLTSGGLDITEMITSLRARIAALEAKVG